MQPLTQRIAPADQPLNTRAGWLAHLHDSLPALLAGLIAWIAFLVVGDTPLIRASGLALIIVGLSMALRAMGAALAIIGGLALAFSPAFWTQTGGAESLQLGTLVAALIGAGALTGALIWFGRRPVLGAALGLAIFAVLFLLVVGTPRSLRMTTLTTAWLLFLLIDILLASNPRPHQPRSDLRPWQIVGLLLLLAIGTLNEPLFALLLPAVVLGLALAKARCPLWYWIAIGIIAGVGSAGILSNYVSPVWWGVDPAAVPDGHVPFIVAGAWRDPLRWLALFDLIVRQFTGLGLALGVLGLARLARWHPPIGVVTLTAYGAYASFGLVYFGEDSAVLLLPLLMIQVLWMTYAVYAFGQWLQNSAKPAPRVVRWAAPALFTLLPLIMLLRIVGVG
ncbi:MAG: hypothetical protein GYB67_08660 [Chloroflexi bacterium]|nr:hypothetical protein [Chloroflexota bacterium]